MEISIVIWTAFILLALLFLTGAPVFVCLGLSGLVGMYMTRGAQGLFQLPAAILGQLDSFLLVALPLYIMMGEALSRSGVRPGARRIQ